MALPNSCCDGKGCYKCPRDKNGGIVLVTIIHRCPWKIINDGNEINQFLSAYFWTRRGDMGSCTLPEPGGLLDQSNSFVRACELMDHEISSLRSKE